MSTISPVVLSVVAAGCIGLGLMLIAAGVIGFRVR